MEVILNAIYSHHRSDTDMSVLVFLVLLHISNYCYNYRNTNVNGWFSALIYLQLTVSLHTAVEKMSG